MNYDHLYHAGNHADVLKHLALIALIKALSQKPTPWCYIDTHAGGGIYDLSQLSRLTTPEYKSGVRQLILSTDEKPALCTEYLQLVNSVNADEHLRFYPGSTYFVRQLAREQDRLIACELKHSAYESLKHTFARDKKVAVHYEDGYLGLKAFVPPKEKRGLVLIDPPYEQEDDWKQVIVSLKHALSRWQTGHYLVWYPIKERSHVMGWLRKLRSNIDNEILIMEMCPYEASSDYLHGSGLALINPVWKFDDQFRSVLNWVWNTLSVKKQGYCRLLSIDSVLK